MTTFSDWKDTAGEELARSSVLAKSTEIFPSANFVRGYDFSKGTDLEAIMHSYKTVGFQGTNLGIAFDIVNEMINWRPPQESVAEISQKTEKILKSCQEIRCTIFLGYTSNLISSGIRENILFLVRNKMVDVLVTTAGGVEEDLIKCLAPTYIGDFDLKGAELREQGLNRIGNLLIPNSNYISFEAWLCPILDALVEEQKSLGTHWTPSKVIKRLGKEINNEDSIYYWAYKNDINVYCPALTDGSIGDMIFFHSFKHPGLRLDIVEDLRQLNFEALRAARSGLIILGGGLVKHHICNANLMRNGADYAVFINTGQEYDGSDAGARPDEAVSWGKLALQARSVKVFADATIVFPLLVSQTFAKSFVPK